MLQERNEHFLRRRQHLYSGIGGEVLSIGRMETVSKSGFSHGN